VKKRFFYWIFLFIIDLFVSFFSLRIIEKNLILEVLGILFIVYAFVLNIIAGRTLKLYAHKEKTKKFSIPDKFVDFGIYKCMRHPGQFGNLFLLTGIAFLSSKLIAILFAGWIVFFGVLFILFVEEKEAIKKFGEKYCEYLSKTPPFNFSFKCLIESLKYVFIKN